MANIVPKFESYTIVDKASDKSTLLAVNQFIKDWNNDEDTIVVNTSGSTGKPKAITLEKRYMLASAKASCAYFKLKKNSTFGLALNLSTIGAKMLVLRALLLEGIIVILPNSRNPIQHLDEELDFISMVPMQTQGVFSENPEKFDLCKIVLIGGASISVALKEEIVKSKHEFYESYGMTETYSHIALRKVGFDYFEALPDVTFSTSNTQLIIDAPALGIRHLLTNDCVTLLDEQRFILLGRTDFAINSGGYKFHPEILEQKLSKYIQDAFFIIGEKDHEFGEIVTLWIEGEENLVYKQKLEEIIKVELSRYERPKKIYFSKAFKRTNSGKLMRFESSNIKH